MWLIYEEFRLNEEAGSLHNITDLIGLTLKKDNPKIEHLAKFLLNWQAVLSGMKDEPPEQTLQVLFYEQVRHFQALSLDVAVYDRSMPGSAERSYQFLVQAVTRLLEKCKHERNRKEIEQAMNAMNRPAAPAKGKKGGKGKGKGAGQKGNTKGDGKGKSNNNTGKGIDPNVCRSWAIYGVCPRGNQCPYTHTPNKQGSKGGKKGGKKGKGQPKGNANHSDGNPPPAAPSSSNTANTAADGQPKPKGKAKAKAAPSQQVNS